HLSRVKNERDAAPRQLAGYRGAGLSLEPDIEDGNRDVVPLRLGKRVLQALTGTDNDRPGVRQHGLQLHQDDEIILDQQYAGPVQRARHIEHGGLVHLWRRLRQSQFDRAQHAVGAELAADGRIRDPFFDQRAAEAAALGRLDPWTVRLLPYNRKGTRVVPGVQLPAQIDLPARA